jgi:hypothetical protein
MAKSTPARATDWSALTMQAWSLGAESSWVIWLRCARFAQGGPNAGREAHRMVEEKWQAQVDLATALVTGKLGTDPGHIVANTIDHYSTRVQANSKRLARG